MSTGDDNIDNAEAVTKELLEFCGSDSLSEEGLRVIFERHELTPHNHNLEDYPFFFDTCENERVTEGVIRLLLEYFPDAASATDDGWAPLHSACYNKNMKLDIIQLLVDAAPDTLGSTDDHGRMPLNILCFGRMDEATSIHILKLLIEKYPNAVRHVGDGGRLPIHIAARESNSAEFCQVLIEAYPGSERIANAAGELPLHRACISTNVAKVEYFYKLYPDAINHETTNGNFPIHYAISISNRSDKLAVAVDILKFLLDCDPGVKLQWAGGMSLLQVACLEKYSDSNIDAALEIIQVIYDDYPESIRIEDSGGQLPLHYCCRGDAYERGALKMLKLLLEGYPEGVRHADRHGRLPIHHAARHRSSEFCRVLIEAYPGSEQMSSLSGFLPLHYACCYNTAATVECLHILYPDAINHATTNGDHPIHLATVRSSKRDYLADGVETVQYLLDCDPIAKFQKCKGISLLHFACYLTTIRQVFNDSNINTALEIIKALYDAHPEAIEDEEIAQIIRHCHEQVQAFINSETIYARQAKDQSLMTTPDDNGRLPLHIALQNNVRLGSIKLLVKGNPIAVQTPDSSGALALHLACQYHDSASVVSFLVGLNTSTLNVADGAGNTALHLACRGARHEIIALLLDEFGAISVSKQNGCCNKLPIDALWESNADRESVAYTESVYRLLRAYPEMIMGIGLPVQSASASASCLSLTGKKRKLGEY